MSADVGQEGRRANRPPTPLPPTSVPPGAVPDHLWGLCVAVSYAGCPAPTFRGRCVTVSLPVAWLGHSSMACLTRDAAENCQ